MPTLVSITDYKNIGDWFYLITATILVDVITIFLTKYPGPDPYFKTDVLDEWYTKFTTTAVLSDVASILIGLGAARYIYTALNLNNPFLFVLILLLFQLCHDVFFFLAVIRPIPKGENQLIDVFKAYAEENGHKILLMDALLMLGSAGVAFALKSVPDHITTATLILSLYVLSYIIYTRKATTKTG